MVRHALWSLTAARLYVWAEQAPTGRRGRAGTAKQRPHPHAVAADRLASLVSSPSTATTLLLQLPSGEGRPLPCPELVRRIGSIGGGEAPLLQEWQVPALALEPEAALQWLSQAQHADPEPSPDEVAEVTDGADFRYWRACARFALGLLRRERWLPTVARDAEGRSVARWIPALNLPEDAARFRMLCEAMPASCRAFGEADAPPSRQSLLRDFLAAVTDATVRGACNEGRDRHLPALAPPTSATGTGAAWWRALTSGDGRIVERAENLRPLVTALQTWIEPIQGSGDAGFRTCFRLDPPTETAPEEEPWSLTFWIQAIDEPSLLVPASQVWAEGRSLAALGRQWEAPQERMLPALARAARIFPPVGAALKRKQPTGCSLSTPEAYQFLREAAPLLEETGNGVVTPDWWRRPSSRLGVRVRMRSASAPSAAKGILTQEKLVEFDWQVALGDEPLSQEEFARLAALKTPLVRLRGKWVEVRPDEVERAIQAWERRRLAGPMGLLDALRLGEGEGDLPLAGLEAEGSLRELLGRLQGEERPEAIPLPEGFHGALRPYQQFGLEWLAFLREWGLGACLADDMGLGKTIQTLAYLLHVRREGMAPTLLVCPTSLVENWRREATRFAPSLRVYVHHGAGRVRERDGDAARFAGLVAGHDLVITTYPLCLRDEQMLRGVTWDTIILDEAQNIKNPGARQTRAIRALPAPTRIAMTGTPVENRLTDLWSLMEFLNPGFLGSERGFRTKYAVRIERKQDPEATERLRRLTRPFILRRVKTDPTVIQDLPEKQEMKVVCTLTAEQATLYEAVVKEMLDRVDALEGMERRGLVLGTLSRLKQICNHPAHFLSDGSALPGRSGKLERLGEMLEEVLSVGEAALVFTQFAQWGELLQAHLRAALRRDVLFLHGGVPRPKRDEMVTRFQAPEGPPVMLLSLKAGGVGLNLTRASHVFHFDRWWNPAVENQATDRAFRIGQTRSVQVHKFLCAGTLEDQIDAMIEQKRELAQNIVGAGEGWLTELSTAQLRDLVTLRASSS